MCVHLAERDYAGSHQLPYLIAPYGGALGANTKGQKEVLWDYPGERRRNGGEVGMTYREKVIKGLECCISEQICRGCPYKETGECEDRGYYYSKAIEDAIVMLKNTRMWWHMCDNCESPVSQGDIPKDNFARKYITNRKPALGPRHSTFLYCKDGIWRCGFCEEKMMLPGIVPDVKTLEKANWNYCPFCGGEITIVIRAAGEYADQDTLQPAT